MSTIMAKENVEVSTRQEALEQNVLLLCPTIGWPKGMYHLPRKKSEVVVDGETVSKDDVTTPRAKLITDKYPVDASGMAWKKRLQKLDSRLEMIKDKYSVKFPIAGVRIVPKSRGQAFMNELYGLTLGTLRTREARLRDSDNPNTADEIAWKIRDVLAAEGENAPINTPVLDETRDTQSIAYDLHVAAREFCGDLPGIIDQIRRSNAVFSQVESRFPTNPGIMRAKFHLDVVPVELAGGVRSTEVTRLDLDEHNDIVREACRRRVDDAIGEMINAPRQQLADALASLNALIARDGRVTTKTFKRVREAIAKIRMFDFVASSDLMDQIGQLEHRLNITTPMNLDSVTAANNGFTAAIEGFMSEVEDAEQQAQDLQEFGREFRAIDLD